MPPISQPMAHEFIYPDEEMMHPTGRIRYTNHSLPSRPLLFQHPKITIDHLASSSVSNSFLSDKYMYERPQITKHPLQGRWYDGVSFVAMIIVNPIHLRSPNAPEDITFRVQVSNISPSTTKMCLYSCTVVHTS